MVSKDSFDALSSRVDTTERSVTELARAIGKIEGSLAEIRWTNRLLVGGVLALAIKGLVWPLVG